MHKNYLALRPSSYYFEQFKEDLIEILPYQESGHYTLVGGKLIKATNRVPNSIWFSESPEQGHIKIHAVDSYFDIYFLDLINSQVGPTSIEMARSILQSIVELDAHARSFSV